MAAAGSITVHDRDVKVCKGSGLVPRNSDDSFGTVETIMCTPIGAYSLFNKLRGKIENVMIQTVTKQPIIGRLLKKDTPGRLHTYYATLRFPV